MTENRNALAFLSVDDVADELDVSKRTVRRWMREKGLPYIKIGRVVRFDAEAINRWAHQQNEAA